MRVKILTNYIKNKQDYEKLFSRYSNYTKKNTYRWNDIEYCAPQSPLPYDAVIVYNTPFKACRISCISKNVFAIMQESSYMPGSLNTFLHKGLSQYHKVISPVVSAKNVIPSHGYLGWSFKKTYMEMREVKYTEKTKALSSIISNLTFLPAHAKRLAFLEKAKKHLDIDHFGRGFRFIKDKWEALYPYRYSIAIENASIPYYFTEKINDCFAAYTIPFYYGCRNIDKYFPKDAYIWIDIDRPTYAIEKIRDVIIHENPEERKDALIEARELVLKKYHMGPDIEVLQQYINKNGKKKNIFLRSYPKAPLWSRIKRKIKNIRKRFTS